MPDRPRPPGRLPAREAQGGASSLDSSFAYAAGGGLYVEFSSTVVVSNTTFTHDRLTAARRRGNQWQPGGGRGGWAREVECMSATARAPLSITALSRMTWPQAEPAAAGQPVLQVVQGGPGQGGGLLNTFRVHHEREQ